MTPPQMQSTPEDRQAEGAVPPTEPHPPTCGRPPDPLGRAIWIVVVGGLDPGGCAGLLRDVATAGALGARAHALGTAWTEQGRGLHRVEPRDPEAVGAALANALATLRPAAVKIGMATSPATAAALVEALAGFAGPVVVDPVLATSRGGALWSGEPREFLPLLRRASLVTPNAVEAAALSGRPIATVPESEAAGRHLVEANGLQAVLVKGGHLADSDASVTDILVTATGVTRYPHPRLPGPSPRGTGCALATAIAIELGRGLPLGEAVEAAIDWLAAAITAATDVGEERHLSHAARHEALRSPHPESDQLAEEGFAEWASSLPEEETRDLVDLESGTPVQWIPDEGWGRGRK